MKPCEWCEEEIVTSSDKTKVMEKELALCDECHFTYKKGGIVELNKRRDRGWD
jgi:ribosome-binding protein aMBF1 (putative translation factor)